jgi:hypothetical protein
MSELVEWSCRGTQILIGQGSAVDRKYFWMLFQLGINHDLMV